MSLERVRKRQIENKESNEEHRDVVQRKRARNDPTYTQVTRGHNRVNSRLISNFLLPAQRKHGRTSSATFVHCEEVSNRNRR